MATEPNGPAHRPTPGRALSYEPERVTERPPKPPQMSLSLKIKGSGGSSENAARKPHQLPLEKCKSVSPSPRKPHIRNFPFKGPASSPGKRERASSRGVADEKQEKQLEEIKRRMGTLTLQEGKNFQLVYSELEVVKRMGSGICGEVFHMRHKPSGFNMAAKKMVWLDDHEERKRILMDLHVMTSHKSPHIVQYFGSVIWNNEVWVFMELMATCLDRLLRKIRKPFPEEIVCKITVSVLKALEYLKNQHAVIHRDVKPSNILLDRSGRVKLCDFGISGRLVDSQAFTRTAGCAAYMAPERINLQESNKGYDIRADIWSLGITLVEIATGSPPYAATKRFTTEFELLTHIVEAPPPLPDRSKYSPEFYDFLSKCLTKDVEKRPHYAELLDHPLIAIYEQKEVDIARWFAEVSSAT